MIETGWWILESSRDVYNKNKLFHCFKIFYRVNIQNNTLRSVVHV